MKFRSLAPALWAVAAFAIVMIWPDTACAQGFGEAEGRLVRFLANLRFLLNIASAIVVSSAVVFSGYQLAFARKRIAEVAPILIGGLLIGAAAQLADLAIGVGSGEPATQPAVAVGAAGRS